MRAARGAGFAWGLAEEAGFAVHWLCKRGLPGAQALAHRLSKDQAFSVDENASPDSQRDAPERPRCPVLAGTHISDRAHQDSPTADRIERDIGCPVLILPFLSTVSRQRGQAIIVRWGQQAFVIDHDGHCYRRQVDLEREGSTVVTDCESLLTRADVQWSASDGSATARWCHPEWRTTPAQRASVDAATLATLSDWAHRTYAPATDESRRLGAGGAD